MERPRDARRRPDDIRQDDDEELVRTREGAREARRVALMIEIAARLGPVCEHLTDEDFAQLVSDMADTKLRFAAIDGESWPRRDREVQSKDDPPTAPADV